MSYAAFTRGASDDASDDVHIVMMAQGGKRGLGRYIKKKGLDPLETYGPPVLQARQQLQKAGEIMGAPGGSCMFFSG